ncbi:hypothetical protein FNV43_RR14107 [Rhamnella rubrinervis]|uniref:DUF7755 domain-containing protein n=1 Tax=Rhamnella rubrinervis TaxID=2594499 RepID=A0A8K0H2E0_9ROSA|nr:hypothetical protein FNV43_RR14107 [Rhamnella rubrinervis]
MEAEKPSYQMLQQKGKRGKEDEGRITMNCLEFLLIHNPMKLKKLTGNCKRSTTPILQGHEHTLMLDEAYKVFMRDDLRRKYDTSMASVPLRHAISATPQNLVGRKNGNPDSVFHIRRSFSQTRRHRLPLIWFKQIDYQDFQGYAKPSRLLPATGVNLCSDTLVRKIFTSFSDKESRSLYMVKLGTSNVFGSSLSDLNAGILLCLINENGDAILQRISASLITDYPTGSKNDTLHFQRGCLDELTFEGPNLGRVAAIWVGLESGQWRLGSVSLTVISRIQTSLEEQDEDELQYFGFKYEFEVEDILLGEGSENFMVELRPCHVTEVSGADPSTLFNKSLSESTSLANQGISNEESMREYADLKLSLLLYDSLLIFMGTSVASFWAGEHAAFAFLIGGISGFLYLLLLQRSVDGLPATASNSQNTGIIDQIFGGYKGPIFSVALAIGFVLFTVKYSSGDPSSPTVFAPKDIILGMIGFLACKVAVVLAAFKPLKLQ